ncbi:hypothetical protein JOF41_005216 [Saccharothrix coeruleofusca]|nr:hypothetical protein [Saccharothrix coeruleofusca]
MILAVAEGLTAFVVTYAVIELVRRYAARTNDQQK